MKSLNFTLLILFALLVISACGKLSKDQTGPEITDIKTSGNVLVISDCSGTSVTISSRVTDLSGIAKVQLWYRTGSDQQYLSADMEPEKDIYTVNLNGPDFLGRPYGTLEFYIDAGDKAGNSSRSKVNQDIQFLPCVNN